MVIVAFCLGMGHFAASAATLITEEEALRPVAPPMETPRAITRGPSVQFEAPSPAIAHKPFAFRVKLEAHGGATIDPAKLHVTYLKMPNVDLTDRLRPFVTAEGIDMPDAETPAGQHPLRIDVEDSDGRITHAMITLTVEKKAP
jgi:hypothetical protein